MYPLNRKRTMVNEIFFSRWVKVKVQFLHNFRLDFDKFEIAQPGTNGNCATDQFDAVGNSGNNPPRVCGSLTGQHSNHH